MGAIGKPRREIFIPVPPLTEPAPAGPTPAPDRAPDTVPAPAEPVPAGT